MPVVTLESKEKVLKKTQRKPKLSIIQQIDHMRDKKGIQFNIITESEALEFLTHSNYYFKLKAFAKNYQKYTNCKSEKYDHYMKLEFAYLKELSTLDAILRKTILKMVLDVEHFLKVQLIADVSEQDKEDGYAIVDKYLTKIKPYLKEEVISKSKNSYCHELIEKYKDNFAIWNIIEVLSFGDFIDLYELYYSHYDNKYNLKGKLLPIKWLRNAAAHNNCLINNLIPPFSKEIEPNLLVMNTISKIKHMPRKTRMSKMKNPPIHDIVVLLDVYCTIIKSEKTLLHGLQELSDFVHIRCLKHKEYFVDNEVITSNYEFFVKVVDFYYKMGYTNIEEQKTK